VQLVTSGNTEERNQRQSVVMQCVTGCASHLRRDGLVACGFCWAYL